MINELKIKNKSQIVDQNSLIVNFDLYIFLEILKSIK